jgi:hypothetical protein
VRVSRIAKIAAAVLLLAALTGYLASRSRGNLKFVSYTPIRATIEFRAEATSLRLAPGWSWPATPLAKTAPDGRGMMYERGFGKQAADHYWYCSWATRALDTRITPADRAQSVETAVGLRKTFYFTNALAPESRPFVDDFLTRAQQGDLSRLARDVKLNCPKMPGE